MKQLMSILAFMALSTIGFGQKIPDLTFTDTEGRTHKLYEDYLDKGTTVVVKLFFVDCPPCNALAPEVQNLYLKWGEGKYDVEFIEVTTRSRDTDADIDGYKNRHGITFPGVSHTGGGDKVLDELRSGAYGSFIGTPSFAVIAPDGTTQINYSALNTVDERITATGATGMEEVAETTLFEVNIEWPDGFSPNIDSLTIQLQSSDASQIFSLLPFLNENKITFNYPNEDIPSIDSPTLFLEYKDAASSANNLNGADVILLRKHILGLKPFENEDHLKAADTNLDDRINGNDVVILRKVILGILSDFRNANGYFPKVNNILLSPNPGNVVNVPIKMIKMGNFN